MRITDSFMHESYINSLQTTLARLNDLNLKVVSGKEVNAPSDAPEKIGRMINMRDSLTNVDQYKKNTDEMVKYMESSETPMITMENIMNDAKTMAIKGANDTYSASDRTIMAQDIDNKLKELISLANTQSEGKYIFSGFKTDVKPFTEVTNAAGDITDVTYNGDTGLMPTEVYKGEIINKNVPGTAFKSGATDIFKTLIDLRDHLRANNTAAVGTDIQAVSTTQDTIVQMRTDIGAKLKRSDNIEARISSTKTTLLKLQSKLEDVDMPEVLSSFQLQQNVYNAAMKSIGSILSMNTLADVIR